ncbi:hypothetical protein PR048_007711, partial [Dryococelus australis]
MEEMAKLLENIEKWDKPVTIKVTNGNEMFARKRGRMRLYAALIAPGLSHNLFSVKRINNEGRTLVFEKDVATITDKESFSMKCERHENLF